MPKTRRLALLGLAGCIAAGHGPISASASSVGKTCIELRRTVSGFVAVPVQIEAAGISSGPYWFLLDTGSEATLIDEHLAGVLNLAASSRTTIVTPSGPIEAIASRASLTFGSVQVGDLEMVRDPLAALRAVAPDVRGILGQDVLRRTNWLLDYRQGVVVQDPDGWLGLQRRGDPLPVRWIGDLPTVEASFGRATPVRLVLDSAANGIVLFELPIGLPTGTSARMKTLGIGQDAPILATDALHIGPITLPRPTAAVLPQARTTVEAGGVLPTSLFETLYFDQAGQTATVTLASETQRTVQSTTCKLGK